LNFAKYVCFIAKALNIVKSPRSDKDAEDRVKDQSKIRIIANSYESGISNNGQLVGISLISM